MSDNGRRRDKEAPADTPVNLTNNPLFVPPAFFENAEKPRHNMEAREQR